MMKIKYSFLILILSIIGNASEIKNSTCMIEEVTAPQWVCKPTAPKGYISAIGYAKTTSESYMYLMAESRARTNIKIKKANYNGKHLRKISISESRFTENWITPSGGLYVQLTAKISEI